MKPPSGKVPKKSATKVAHSPLAPHERELAEYFVQMASILGIQRSVAEIYALLYLSAKPIDFDTIQGRLMMSKGSVSQGLRFLRLQGMILSTKLAGSRREHWRPTPSLAVSLVNLLRSQFLPSIEKSKPLLQAVLQASRSSGVSSEVIERITRLQQWNSRALELSELLLPPPKAD